VTGETSTLYVLGKYAGGLHVSVKGNPRWPVFEDLRAKKRALRASGRGVQEFGSVPGVPGGPFMLTTDGGAKYQFQMHNGAIKYLEVTRRGSLPEVIVQFRAQTLYVHNLDEVETIVDAIANHFVEPGYKSHVSRFDIALDFQCEDWTMPEWRDIDCSAEWDSHGKPTSPTSMTLGSDDGSLQVQIYDKSREIKGKARGKKEWIEDVWMNNKAYDNRLPVIRVELRFFRRFLKEFQCKDPETGRLRGIDTLGDLRPSIGDLVRHVVVGRDGKRPWVSVASPDSRDRNTKCRAPAPWWSDISQAFPEGMPDTGRIRLRSASSSPSYKHTRSMSAAWIVKHAAQARLRGLYPGGSLESFMETVLLPETNKWIDEKGFGSWEEVVDRELRKRRADGSAPPSE
jgi:hypothetical protein